MCNILMSKTENNVRGLCSNDITLTESILRTFFVKESKLEEMRFDLKTDNCKTRDDKTKADRRAKLREKKAS